MFAKRLIAALLALGLPIAHADTETLAEQAVRLEVRPVLCITDERTSSCEMSFLVLWASDQTGYYCLYNDFAEAPVRCWSKEQAGELTDERNVQTDFNYWMTGKTETRLAMVTVEVLRMDTDDRRRKRRTRHVWDIL